MIGLKIGTFISQPDVLCLNRASPRRRHMPFFVVVALCLGEEKLCPGEPLHLGELLRQGDGLVRLEGDSSVIFN